MTSPSPTPSWRWPRPSVRGGAVMLGILTLVAIANGLAVWLAFLGDDEPISMIRPLVWEGTSAFALWLTLPIVLTATTNAPVPTRRWGRLLAIHAVGFVLTSAAHIALMIAGRYAVYALAGWGVWDGGPLTLRVPMEALRDLSSYALLATLFTLLQSWRERQRQSLRAAQLETELRAAQLHHLSANLHPHFLFNALNTISAVMYEDLGKTDRLIADLGDLLRQSLEAKSPAWPLRDERAYVEKYVAVLRARFGPRLSVSWDVTPELEDAAIPRFAIQTLVENAVKHNAEAAGALNVGVRAAPSGASEWHVEVTDDGRGFGAPPGVAEANGTGLAQLRRRVVLLHGEAARVEASNTGRGARVVLTLPRVSP